MLRPGILLRSHHFYQTHLSFCLIFPYLNPSLLSLTDCIRLPRLYLLSLITPIFDCPLNYLVAEYLSPYQCQGSYLVQYIDPQSGGTGGFRLCPLSLLALFTQSHLAVYKLYSYSTWDLKSKFSYNQDF